MFHKEGYRIIGFTLLVCGVINFLSYKFIQTTQGKLLVLLTTIFLFILILQFFRNPVRLTSIDDKQVIAPVDGKIVAIEEIYEKEYFKDNRLQVSVFMSPLNVHVTRYPVSGKVVYSKYHPGKYLVAWHPKSSDKNERTTVVVDSVGFGEVLFRQIAGAVARRIVNYAEPGQKVVQGNDSGFIKFGSRVDVLLPVDTKMQVELEQKVRGGETIIAKSD